jgi:hypothetical protein
MPERNSMVDCSAARATVFGFGEHEINMNFDAALKLLEGAVGGLVQERARFAGAGLEFKDDFLGHDLFLFHQTDKLAIGDTSSERFKFFGGTAHGLLDGREIQRSIAGSTFGKASCF